MLPHLERTIMEKCLLLLEKTLIQNGYHYTIGHIAEYNGYQIFFWNDCCPIVYGCSINVHGFSELISFGSLEYSTLGLGFGCYTGCQKDELTEQIILDCIAEVYRMVKYETETELFDERMRSVLGLGNHTTDIDLYFRKYGYRVQI